MNVFSPIRRLLEDLVCLWSRKPRGRSRRQAIREAARRVGEISQVPWVPTLDPTAFHALAEKGSPFVIHGLVGNWPLTRMTLDDLGRQFPSMRVRMRTGDYVGSAFTSKRIMVNTSLAEYISLVRVDRGGLPPYLGNQKLRRLNALCEWPAYFKKCDAPRIWMGPAGTVTPLHCDYDDNLFAQIWGRKRFILFPPHHDEFLYTRESNPLLFASGFDPESPDFDAMPLARHAHLVECVVEPGDLLYLPAGWFHHVRALEFSLSANLWTGDVPCALVGDRLRNESTGTPAAPRAKDA